MLCRNPFMGKAYGPRVAFPCGQCMPCLINRARIWMSRIVLETMCHKASCFVTLTYDPDHLPSDGSLRPKDVQDFFKRLRRRLEEAGMPSIRYYVVGEYGPETWRPHYHAAIFGIGPEDHDFIFKAWSLGGVPLGFVQVGDLNVHSARYISGYVTQKLTKPEDPRLKGKHPEFSRMSRRPGIGTAAVKEIAKTVLSRDGQIAFKATGDVPFSIHFQGRDLPLGRYLRMKLREFCDVFTVDQFTGEVKYGATKVTQEKQVEELSDLFEAWFNDPEAQKKPFKKYLSDIDMGRVMLMESKLKSKRKRKL